MAQQSESQCSHGGITMKYITKVTAQLSKVSRGLDKSHPEYKPTDTDKLARHLRRAMKSIRKLERNHDDLQTDICTINSMMTDLMVEVQKRQIDYTDIPGRIVEIIDVSRD